MLALEPDKSGSNWKLGTCKNLESFFGFCFFPLISFTFVYYVKIDILIVPCTQHCSEDQSKQHTQSIYMSIIWVDFVLLTCSFLRHF